MIKVFVLNTNNYPVSAKSISEAVKKVFREHNIKNVETSVAIVSESEMIRYATSHLKETKAEAAEHPVLSFPVQEIEREFVFPPGKNTHLGEIIVSYPKAVEQSKLSSNSIDTEVSELAAHGALHLIGIHHD